MKLTDLQQTLQQKKIPALLVTRNKPYFVGEDILPQENKILSLTGFSGSAGNLLITADKAWLFVDGRYSIQARNETDADKVTVVDYSGSFAEIFLQAPFYETEDGVFEDGSVTVRVLPPVSEYAYDGEITIGEYPVRARYRATADGYEVYAEEFMLKIAGDGITFERLGKILDLVIIL